MHFKGSNSSDFISLFIFKLYPFFCDMEKIKLIKLMIIKENNSIYILFKKIFILII